MSSTVPGRSQLATPVVGLLTNSFAPYKEPLLTALAQRVDLTVYYCSFRETDRRWSVDLSGRYRYVVMDGYTVHAGRRHLHFNPSILTQLRNERPDVLIVGGYSYPTALLATFEGRRLGIPMLLWSGSTLLEGARSPAGEWAKRRLMEMFSGYIAYTTHASRYLESLGAPPESITVAQAAVDVDFFANAVAQARQAPAIESLRRTLNISSSTEVALFVGQHIHRKGGDLVIEALARMQDRGPTLLMVGSGPALEEWQQLARRLGVEEKIRWCGHKQQKELIQYYAVADMLILPSRAEAAGRVVNEALASGIPVIVSDRVGTDALRRDREGLVFRSCDVGDLAECIAKLMHDPMLRRRLGDNGATRMAVDITIDKEADQFAYAIDRVLARHPRVGRRAS